MQRGLFNQRAGWKRIAVVFQRESQAAKLPPRPVAPDDQLRKDERIAEVEREEKRTMVAEA